MTGFQFLTVIGAVLFGLGLLGLFAGRDGLGVLGWILTAVAVGIFLVVGVSVLALGLH